MCEDQQAHLVPQRSPGCPDPIMPRDATEGVMELQVQIGSFRLCVSLLQQDDHLSDDLP